MSSCVRAKAVPVAGNLVKATRGISLVQSVRAICKVMVLPKVKHLLIIAAIRSMIANRLLNCEKKWVNNDQTHTYHAKLLALRNLGCAKFARANFSLYNLEFIST